MSPAESRCRALPFALVPSDPPTSADHSPSFGPNLRPPSLSSTSDTPSISSGSSDNVADPTSDLQETAVDDPTLPVPGGRRRARRSVVTWPDQETCPAAVLNGPYYLAYIIGDWIERYGAGPVLKSLNERGWLAGTGVVRAENVRRRRVETVPAVEVVEGGEFEHVGAGEGSVRREKEDQRRAQGGEGVEGGAGMGDGVAPVSFFRAAFALVMFALGSVKRAEYEAEQRRRWETRGWDLEWDQGDARGQRHPDMVSGSSGSVGTDDVWRNGGLGAGAPSKSHAHQADATSAQSAGESEVLGAELGGAGEDKVGMSYSSARESAEEAQSGPSRHLSQPSVAANGLPDVGARGHNWRSVQNPELSNGPSSAYVDNVSAITVNTSSATPNTISSPSTATVPSAPIAPFSSRSSAKRKRGLTPDPMEPPQKVLRTLHPRPLRSAASEVSADKGSSANKSEPSTAAAAGIKMEGRGARRKPTRSLVSTAPVASPVRTRSRARGRPATPDSTPTVDEPLAVNASKRRSRGLGEDDSLQPVEHKAKRARALQVGPNVGRVDAENKPALSKAGRERKGGKVKEKPPTPGPVRRSARLAGKVQR